ncbi:MAG: hypothetical protein E6R08_10090 [Nevskiaceae bacterium]|nr:MAG: hypothetical protein E6R08_10090 [Nevskiaceae bacterium]
MTTDDDPALYFKPVPPALLGQVFARIRSEVGATQRAITSTDAEEQCMKIVASMIDLDAPGADHLLSSLVTRSRMMLSMLVWAKTENIKALTLLAQELSLLAVPADLVELMATLPGQFTESGDLIGYRPSDIYERLMHTRKVVAVASQYVKAKNYHVVRPG